MTSNIPTSAFEVSANVQTFFSIRTQQQRQKLRLIFTPSTTVDKTKPLPVVSATADAAPEPVEAVPVPDDDLPAENFRDQRAVRVAFLAHPEVGHDPHRCPLRRAEQAECHGQLLAVRGDHTPLLLFAHVQRHLRRVRFVAIEPQLPLHLVEHLVDVARPRVRPVLRHEPVQLAAYLHGADPGGLREAPVHRLCPELGGSGPVLGPGVHVRDDDVVAGVRGAEAPQLLEGALGEIQIAVDPAGVQQASPGRVRRPRGHAPDERARVVQPSGARHQVHHAAVVLRVGRDVVLQPHAVEAPQPVLEQPGAAAGVQHADVRGCVGRVALPDHRVEHLQGLPPVPVQRQAGQHGAVRPRVLVVHRVEHRRGLLDAAALGVHVHQGRLHDGVQPRGVPQQRAVETPPDVEGTQVRARRERADRGALVGTPPIEHHRAERLEAFAPQPGFRVRREECAPGSRRSLLRLHPVKRQTSHRRLDALAVEADQAVLHVFVVLEPEFHDVRLQLLMETNTSHIRSQRVDDCRRTHCLVECELKLSPVSLLARPRAARTP
jgi:hypothetical protein